jgi:hypothetical protein
MTLVVSLPLPLQMNEVWAGADIDVYFNPWVDWWTHHVLTTPGESLYFTDYLFYPDGVSLVFHSFSHVNTAISLALQPFVGQPTAYNVTILLAHLLSAFGMYLLIDYLTESSAAGIISGIVFTFNPYHIFESIHPVLVSTQWIPLSLLFLMRWLRERRWWQVVLAALFFLLNALTSWHLMSFFSLWLIVLTIHYLGWSQQASFWKRLRGIAAYALLSGLFILPFLWPLIREQLTAAQTYMPVDLSIGRPLDLYHVVLPPWIKWVKKSGYPGLVTLVLVGFGVWKGEGQARMWATSAVLALLIAIGPNPVFKEHPIEAITLPWSSVFVPIFRHTFRFQLLVMFGLAGAAGYGWLVIRDRLAGTRWSAIFISLLLILDYSHWPFPTLDPDISPFYEKLAEQPSDFAIAPLPSTRQTAKYHMHYQTIHGKKIVGGHVSRTPERAMRFMEHHDLIRSISSKGVVLPEITDISHQFDQLHARDIRYLVLHKKHRVGPDLVAQWKEALPLIPTYEDDSLIAYNTDLKRGRDYDFIHSITPDLGVVKYQVDPAEGILQGTFMGLEIYWGAVTPPEQNLSARIELVNQANTTVQVEQRPLYPEWPSSEWNPDTIVIGRYRVRVDAEMPAGDYDVKVGLADAKTGDLLGDLATLTTLQVKPLARTYQLPSPEFRTEGCFDERICLLGYALDHKNEHLVFNFYWQARQLMEHDYVMSTRLLDPSSTSIVWQHDAAPRDWQYPTTWWDDGEVVSDTITCALDEVPTGRYQLEVAVYEPRSGEVLTASSSDQSKLSASGGLLLNSVNVPESDK